jgi:hypothetical protein
VNSEPIRSAGLDVNNRAAESLAGTRLVSRVKPHAIDIARIRKPYTAEAQEPSQKPLQTGKQDEGREKDVSFR